MTEKEKMLSGMFYNPMDEELFQTKNKCYIEPVFFCDYGVNIELGKNFYANHNCVMLDVNKIKIGDNVLFGPNVQVYTATHPLNTEERISGKEMGYPIEIGDNVWICGSVVICPGVKIGKNTTIAAGSIVINDIPENVLAAGNPCKIVKTLHSI